MSVVVRVRLWLIKKLLYFTIPLFQHSIIPVFQCSSHIQPSPNEPILSFMRVPHHFLSATDNFCHFWDESGDHRCQLPGTIIYHPLFFMSVEGTAIEMRFQLNQAQLLHKLYWGTEGPKYHTQNIILKKATCKGGAQSHWSLKGGWQGCLSSKHKPNSQQVWFFYWSHYKNTSNMKIVYRHICRYM